jgi:hypothetical protein
VEPPGKQREQALQVALSEPRGAARYDASKPEEDRPLTRPIGVKVLRNVWSYRILRSRRRAPWTIRRM